MEKTMNYPKPDGCFLFRNNAIGLLGLLHSSSHGGRRSVPRNVRRRGVFLHFHATLIDYKMMLE